MVPVVRVEVVALVETKNSFCFLTPSVAAIATNRTVRRNIEFMVKLPRCNWIPWRAEQSLYYMVWAKVGQ